MANKRITDLAAHTDYIPDGTETMIYVGGATKKTTYANFQRGTNFRIKDNTLQIYDTIEEGWRTVTCDGGVLGLGDVEE